MMFKEEREESIFEWSMIGDIEEGRPNLGPMVHVAVYRLMQFTLRDILIRDHGVEAADKIFGRPVRRPAANHEGTGHRYLPR
jgi:hypothetical protein